MRVTAVFGMIAICLFAVGMGCATATTGNQELTEDNVSKIQKGVTTRQQIVALIGEPNYTQMLGNGGRTMFYQGAQINSNFIQRIFQGVPIIGAVVPTTDTRSTRRESLQVILDANDVVQDCLFSDNTSEVKTTVSMFGGRQEQTTTSNIPAK